MFEISAMKKEDERPAFVLSNVEDFSVSPWRMRRSIARISGSCEADFPRRQ
jgi:hypothetical protein